jgi:hypothetical protein
MKNDRPPGSIRNVIIRDVFARGQGSSVINGHPDNWLDNITFERVRLAISHDPSAPYDKAVDALRFEYARNLRLKDVEVVWEKPAHDQWQAAARFKNVKGLRVSGFRGEHAKKGPPIALEDVEDSVIR